MKFKLTLRKLPKFNSPEKAFCTCPPKYNINPYLGRCNHNCVYCYAVKFPSFIGSTKPRTNLLESIEVMVKNTKQKLPVMFSDCTDPYQPMEKEFKITRKCLEVLAKHGFPILIVTKSDLVTRDLDVLRKTRSVVSISLTTLKDEVARLVEPNAPSPEKRIRALQFITGKGVTTTVRVDPIIPFLNDDEKDFRLLISTVASIGIKQVTISTLKPVKGFFTKLKKINPKLSEKLEKIYEEGEWIMGYKYLPENFRFNFLKKFRSVVLSYGLKFASCREGFPEYNNSICDGTGFLQTQVKLLNHV